MIIDDDAVFHFKPGGFGERVVGNRAGADHDEIGGERIAILNVDREAPVWKRMQSGDDSPETHVDAVRVVALKHERGCLFVGDAGKETRRDLDHRGLDADLGRRGRDFKPDQPAADHDQRFARPRDAP